MSFRLLFLVAVLAGPAFAAPAAAHPGLHEAVGFTGGFLHPLLGWDHLLAMAALGLWLGLSAARTALAANAGAWIAAMAAGFLLGANGFHIPLVEPGILTSVLVLGLLAAAAARVPAAAMAPLMVFFAVFHGHAHGTEAPDGPALTYAAGFLIASLGIILAGFGLARLVNPARREMVIRASGAAIAAAGAVLGFAG